MTNHTFQSGDYARLACSRAWYQSTGTEPGDLVRLVRRDSYGGYTWIVLHAKNGIFQLDPGNLSPVSALEALALA